MKSKGTSTLLAAVCLALLVLAPDARAELLATSADELYLVDHDTATARKIASIQAAGGAMARHPSGALYTTAWWMGHEPPWGSTWIDPETWAISRGPKLPFLPLAVAFSREGTLLALRLVELSPNLLYTIDPETGVATLVGSTGLPGIVALTFGPNEMLYGWDMGDLHGAGGAGLVTVDPLTAVGIDVDPTVNAPEGVPTPVVTLAFAPDGTLYGAGENLYTVDLNSGELTLIGPIEHVHGSVSGMVWIPEPSTLAGLLSLAATAALACLWRRIRRLPATPTPA